MQFSASHSQTIEAIAHRFTLLHRLSSRTKHNARREKLISRHAGGDNCIPQEIQSLLLRDDGTLIDDSTGQIINEFGATRFDVKVRALRGELDPPKGTENNEHNDGILLNALVQYPTTYNFQFVIKPGSNICSSELLDEYKILVEKVCELSIDRSVCSIKERMNGKFFSLTIPATVRSHDHIAQVFSSIENDTRVIMKY